VYATRPPTTLYNPEGFEPSDIQKYFTWNFQKKTIYTNFEDKHFAFHRNVAIIFFGHAMFGKNSS
jgi:hypothetical protein